MKPLSQRAHARLQSANDLVLALLAKGLPPHEVIDELIEDMGADVRFRSGTNQFAFAGVIGTATSGTSAELLGSWRRKAMSRLLQKPGGQA